MISFKTFLHAPLLLEAYDYSQMFTKVLELGKVTPVIDTYYRSYVLQSPEYLKKNFRIIWYNKLMQIYMAWTLDNLTLDDKVAEQNIKQYYKKLLQSECKKFNLADRPDILDSKMQNDFLPRKTLTQYKHFLDLHLKEIDDYNPTGKFPEEVFADMEKIEKEWASELDGTVQYIKQPLDHEEGYPDKRCFPIIEYGNGWYWVDLNTNYCSNESRAMGHCGTGSHGSTLLSLRYLNKRKSEPSTWLWEPHLTFEMGSDDHILYQMKGKQNTKPVEKYHKYILDLLLHKEVTSTKGTESYYIKGIERSSYGQDSDFSTEDLSDEFKEDLFEQRPELMGLMDYYKKVGKTDSFMQRMNELWISKDLHSLEWDEKKEFAVIYEARDLEDLVENYGDDTTKWIVDQDSDPDIEVSDDTIRECYEMLDEKKVEEYIRKEYPDEDEENWEDDMFQFLEDEGDDLYTQCRWAAERGIEGGRYNEMMSALDGGLKSFDITIGGETYNDLEDEAFINDVDNKWNQAPMKVYTNFKTVMLLLTDSDFELENGIGFEIKTSQPYYGFDGWEQLDARNFLKDESGFGYMVN